MYLGILSCVLIVNQATTELSDSTAYRCSAACVLSGRLFCFVVSAVVTVVSRLQSAGAGTAAMLTAESHLDS